MKISKTLCLLVLALVFLGVSAATMYQPEAIEMKTETVMTQADGQEIYLSRCMSCHQTNGEGVQGVFPPLAESEYVSGDKGVLVRMILNGLSGDVEVKGTTYSGMMPPWGGFLNDEQIAQVLTYIRSSFGNDAEAISTEEVASVRAATTDRKDPWTIEDLSQEANQGIPGSE
jgi:mono/diheme cytochrome c family protein